MIQTKFRNEYKRLEILKAKKKNRILTLLKQQFGIENVKGQIIARGEERLFLYQGTLSEQEIKELENTLPVERVGIYFAKYMPNENKVRLSVDGADLFKDQITKNIFELDDEQANQWLYGNEIQVKTNLNDFVIIKHKDDFLGTGKASAEKITNFVPKNRRLKEKS
jgi:NOL1/NOP2/fmu family ribosome biogenesis protein